MDSFRDQLLNFMKTYLQAKKEPFKEHALGNIMRREIPKNIYNQAELDKNKYSVRGSVGQGNWAHVPWIAVMNKEITTSTQRGYYLVYLFSEDMNDIFLAFAQGVTETPIEEMERINEEIRSKLDIKESHIHQNNDFYLGDSRYAIDYRRSTALYIHYSISDFPTEEQLWRDLSLMLGYYEQYIEIKNKHSLSEIMDKFLSDVIALDTPKTDYSQVYGEIKMVVDDLFHTKIVEEPNISQRSKNLLTQLPFINKRRSVYKLAQYTTLDLPDSSYENVMAMLGDLLGDNDRQKEIDSPMESRNLHALRLLEYIDNDKRLYIEKLPDLYEQKHHVISIPIIKEMLYLFDIIKDWSAKDTEQLAKEFIRHTVVSSTDQTPIKESVLNKRFSYIVDWLKSTNVITENLQIADRKFASKYIKDEKIINVMENNNGITNQVELLNHIHNYIRSKGFYYEKEEVINLYLSLRSKPFVILSGISGTGKTKMVQWFAESVGATEDNGQFTLIPIRPDWNDGSDLLGYVDIKGDFKEGPLTTIIRNAASHPELPYFVLLDEMNLARVEHYFSDILSVMESRQWENGEVVSSKLLTEETAGFDLTLPNNLYILGTVNMDETTYPFSKKVLDRANMIEFNRIDLSNLAFLNEADSVDPVQALNTWFKPEYLHLKDAYSSNENLIEQVINELVQINKVLEVDNAHVGYRVRDEICFYMIYNDREKLLDFDSAMDHCILQKILPRISGSDSLVEELLRKLYELFTNKRLTDELELEEVDIETAICPRSAQKVVEMYRRLHDGYTSFWIS